MQARKQYGWGGGTKTADSVADERITGKTHAQQRWRTHGNVIPGRQVVAGPSGRVALRAGISCAGEHERPLIGLELSQAIVGSASIFHSKNIVDGAVIEGRAVIQAVNDVEWH